MSSSSPIGVFDSGIGGITVVRELINRLPNENIIYFGDTARVPYGNKSPETIINYSRQIVKFLMEKGVKAIVIGCNTASAVALEVLRREIPIPIIGVVKPGAKAAAEATRKNRIGVIATRATIESGVYEDFLHKTSPNIEVRKQACPLFVPLVEEGWLDDEITTGVIHRYLDKLIADDIDALVLGCTHYPLLTESIRRVTGTGITLVNPAFECAKEFSYVLEENNLLNTEKNPSEKPFYDFYFSDTPKQFSSFADNILPQGLVNDNSVHTVTLE